MKKYSFPVRVYFSETDAEGIVYFGRYLDFAEHARTEMLREIFGGQGEMMKRSGICFVIKSVKAEYNRPAYLDDLLTVETTLLEMKRFSCTFSQDILRGEELLVHTEIRVACIDLEKKVPALIPEKVLQALSEEQ